MPDPLTIATSFATLIQMVGMFLSGRHGTKKATQEEFLGWLQAHKHDELVKLIVENGAISQSLTTLLEHQQQELLGAIRRLDGLLVQIAANVKPLRALANSTPTSFELSEQCASILQWIVAGEGQGFLPVPGFDTLVAMRGAAPNLEVPDNQFLEDDLRTMCEFGLLRRDYNKKGDPIYYITRPGAAVAKPLAPESS